MRKEYFFHAWNLFEFVITVIGIIDVILVEVQSNYNVFLMDEIVMFLKAVRLLRVLCILKVKNY